MTTFARFAHTAGFRVTSLCQNRPDIGCPEFGGLLYRAVHGAALEQALGEVNTFFGHWLDTT